MTTTFEHNILKLMKTTTDKKHIKNAPDFDAKLPVTYEGKPAEIIRTNLNNQDYPIGAIIDNEELEQFTSKGFYYSHEREAGRLENLWPEPIEGYEMEACGWGGLEGANHDGYISICESGNIEQRFGKRIHANGNVAFYYIKLTKIKEIDMFEEFSKEVAHCHFDKKLQKLSDDLMRDEALKKTSEEIAKNLKDLGDNLVKAFNLGK